MRNATTTKRGKDGEWETEACTRCGGSGHHSYCSQYGTTCFKCHGQGRVLTARSQAAVLWLADQRKTRVADLQPGMRIKMDGYRKPLVLQEVRQSLNYVRTETGPRYYTDLVFANLMHSTLPEAWVEVVPASEDERVAQVRAAIAYQNTLTKTGKPRKLRTANSQLERIG